MSDPLEAAPVHPRDFGRAVRDSVDHLIGELGNDAEAWLRQSANVVANIVESFASTPGSDMGYLIEHGRVRVLQLAAIHLIQASERVRQEAVRLVLAILRGALAVLAA